MGHGDTDRKYALLGLRIVGDFGATIAVPAVLLSWAGKALDARYGTEPKLLVAGFAAAALLSAVAIVKKARAYGREFDALNRESSRTPDEDTHEGQGTAQR